MQLLPKCDQPFATFAIFSLAGSLISSIQQLCTQSLVGPITIVGLCCHPAFLVWVIVITLCCLVSNNKMKMYFVCLQRLRLSITHFGHPWGVLRLPCVLSPSCSYLMSFTRIAVMLPLTIPASSSGAGCWVPVFLSVGEGGLPGGVSQHPISSSSP